MGIPEYAPDRRYTYADYLTWGEDERWELIDGEAFNMSPAPAPRHQLCLIEMAAQLLAQLRSQACRVYPAPFDVRLAASPGDADDETVTVVQPDISVICDPRKVDHRGCIGAPDLVVEILSDSTASRDLHIKRNRYEANGAREYWVVNPWDNTVTVHRLGADGKFADPVLYNAGDRLRTPVLPGVEVELAPVFAPLPEAPEASP